MVVQKDAAILVPEKTDPVGGVASQTSGLRSGRFSGSSPAGQGPANNTTTVNATNSYNRVSFVDRQENPNLETQASRRGSIGSKISGEKNTAPNLRRLSMGMGTSTGGKAVLAKAPWWHSWVPKYIKTYYLRDIKILHEEVEDKIFNQRSAAKKGLVSSEWTFMLHPESSYRLFWDIVTAFFVLILIWLVPFYIGFETWSSPGMSVVSSVMDVWFIIDVFLNFRTGYVDHGATVMDKKKIAKNYLKTWFVIDFFASIPWEIFIGQEETGSKTQDKAARKSAKMTKYFKIPKLLRMARLLRAFNKYARFYALTLVVLGMIVTLHVGACIIAQALEICTAEFLIFDEDTGNYHLESNDNMSVCETSSVMSLYSEAIYVCFTLCIGMSPTGGTLGAASDLQALRGVTITDALQSYASGTGNDWRQPSTMYFMTAILMLLGIGEMSLVVGHIGLLLRDRHLASAVFRGKLDRVKEELKYYRVPWVLQNRVLAYYDYMWVNQKQYDDKITLLTDKGMSSDLRGKLALHMYKDVVQGVSLFSRVDDTFLSKVCMELQTRVFLPGDWIILKGDIGSELYIISRGVCQVFLRDPWEIEESEDPEADKEILLSNGQFFGEISLLMEVRRTTSVQAKTICEVNVLVQEIFEEILRESPDFADEMKSLIVKRKVENFQKLNHEHASMEDREIIEDAVTEAIESRQLSIGGEQNYGEHEDYDEDGNMDDQYGMTEIINRAAVGRGGDPSPSIMTNLPGSIAEGDEEDEPNTPPPRRRARSSVDMGGFSRSREESVDLAMGNLDALAQNLSENTDGIAGGGGFAAMMRMERSSKRRGSSGSADGITGLVSSGRSEGITTAELISRRRSLSESGATSQVKALEISARKAREDLTQDSSSKPSAPSSHPKPAPHISQIPQSSHPPSQMLSTLAAEEFVSNEDIVSQQLGLLQERIDKIYAMLTTKLGRVR